MINSNNCKISRNIRRRFVKDYNLPIKIFDDDMFDYYIDLYDAMHGTKYKYQMLEQSVSAHRGEEGFMKEFNSIKDEIIADISSKDSYKELSKANPPLEYTGRYQIQKQNIYIPEFDRKTMCSIDLKKANFNSMRYYNFDLVNYAETYEDFISKYTAESYMKESKQLRQVIFGNLLPKKQQAIQKVIMGRIINAILDKMDVTLTTMGTDEVIIHEVGSETSFFSVLSNLTEVIPIELLDMLKIERFQLLHAHPTKPFYAKLTTGHLEIKNTPAVYYPQVYKHLLSIPIEVKDLLFEYEGERATFVNPLYPPDD